MTCPPSLPSIVYRVTPSACILRRRVPQSGVTVEVVMDDGLLGDIQPLRGKEAGKELVGAVSSGTASGPV